MISEEQSKIAEELDNLGGVGSQVSFIVACLLSCDYIPDPDRWNWLTQSFKLTKTFQENEANIQANIKIIDDRMTDLLHRIDNLNVKS
jgi:hypothetical protein